MRIQRHVKLATFFHLCASCCSSLYLPGAALDSQTTESQFVGSSMASQLDSDPLAGSKELPVQMQEENKLGLSQASLCFGVHYRYVPD